MRRNLCFGGPARMAKFCFYCGQEIAPGEKCKCRCASGEERSGGSKRGGKNAQSADKKNAGGSAKSTEEGRASSGPRIRRPKRTKVTRPSFRLGTFTDQLRTLFPTFSSGAMSSSGYFLRPATKIRQESLKAKRPFSLVTVLLFSLLTGLLGVILVYSRSHLFTVMLDSIFGKQALEFCLNRPFAAFGALVLITSAFVMILTSLFYLSSRFGNRKPTFRKTFDLVSVSLVYVQIPEIILLISTLMGGRSSISFLFISLILLGLAQLLAFRSALGLSEDAIFLMILFVYAGTYLISKLLVFLLITVAFPS